MIRWVLRKALNLVGGSVVGGLVEGYKATLEAGNTKERIAADLTGRELVMQQREFELQTELRIAQTGRWYTPENLFCYIMVICFGKIVVWDKVLASFTASLSPKADHQMSPVGFRQDLSLGLHGNR